MIIEGSDYRNPQRENVPEVHDLQHEGSYFIFVESAEPVGLEGLLRPDGREIINPTELGWSPWRLRASGIQTGTFLDAMGRFDRLDNHDTVTDDQRGRRRADLNTNFGDTPLPVFDLYVGEEHEAHASLVASFIPGMWYWIGVRRRSEGDLGLPVFVGAPELPTGPFVPGTLEFIEGVPPEIEIRLRDIFSLVHISDAGFEEEPGDEGAPPPGWPHERPPGFPHLLTEDALRQTMTWQADLSKKTF